MDIKLSKTCGVTGKTTLKTLFNNFSVVSCVIDATNLTIVRCNNNFVNFFTTLYTGTDADNVHSKVASRLVYAILKVM